MTHLLMIRPIQKRQSLGADIAQQLQEMLVNGTYKPGDILPSQRALAEQFGTSLATVLMQAPARSVESSMAELRGIYGGEIPQSVQLSLGRLRELGLWASQPH